MALLPARRSGSLARPASQAGTRLDPFADFQDLHERVSRLMNGAIDGLRQPLGQVSSPLVTLPSRARADQVTAILADGVLTVTVPRAETERPRRIKVTAG